jgi:hypothetical protein
MAINFMIKIGMIQNKSASDQMRFTKVIYANNLILSKSLLNAVETVRNTLENDFQTPNSSEVIKSATTFIEMKCNQFFFLN